MNKDEKHIIPSRLDKLMEGRLEDFLSRVEESVYLQGNEIGSDLRVIGTFLDHALVCTEDNRVFRLGLGSDGEVASVQEQDQSVLFGGSKEFSREILERLESLSSQVDSDPEALREYSRLIVSEERRWFFDALLSEVEDLMSEYRKWKTLASEVSRSMLAEAMESLPHDPHLQEEREAIQNASAYRDWKAVLESLSKTAYNLIPEDTCEILESKSEYADAYSELRSDVMRVEQVLSSVSRFARFAPSDQLSLLSERTRNALTEISRARVAIGVNTHESR